MLLIFVCLAFMSLQNTNAQINWNGNNWALACDFKNNDLSNVKCKASECGPKCSTTFRCTHFTWTSYNDGTCWMKSGNVSKKNAIFTGDKSMVCGVLDSSNASPFPIQSN